MVSDARARLAAHLAQSGCGARARIDSHPPRLKLLLRRQKCHNRPTTCSAVDDNGIGRAYRVWEEWVPEVVTTPDGGAWVFFTAQIRTSEGNTDRRLFASRFDPELKVWLPGTRHGLQRYSVRRNRRDR